MNDKLNELKKELAYLKIDFQRRIDEIERKIKLLETQKDKDLKPDESIQIPPIIEPPPMITVSETMEEPREKKPRIQSLINKTFSFQRKKEDDKSHPEDVQKAEVLKPVISGILENLQTAFGPVSGLFVKITEAYRHYQQQGKAPVFFMTIAGILTLVMGFGYLLQYSFSKFLGPTGKVTIGFASAVGIILCGMLIHRKRKDMADYASSLIGLGIILSYLCAYFTGSFYNLIHDIWTFGLLATITGIAYGLALTYKTRVVGIISLLGGTFAPLFMAGASHSFQVYLSYVLVLVIAMLHLSRQINWQVLAHLSMAASFIVIEIIITEIGYHASADMILVIILHLFFYLFSVYNGLEVIRQSTLNRMTMISISSNLFFFLFALNQSVHNHTHLGQLYLFNGLLLLVVCFCIPLLIKSLKEAFTQTRKLLQMVCLLSTGLLTGFGILALIGPDFLGLVWGLEALILLYLGSHFNIVQVRMEALTILTLSLISSGFHATVWMVSSITPAPAIFDLAFGTGWMNLMTTWILLWPCVFLMEKYLDRLILIEKKVLTVFDEFLSVCLSLSFLMSVGIVFAQGIWLFSIVPMFYLIYRAKTKQLVFTEYFGLFHLLLLIVPMVTSAQMVKSFFFTEQIALGKIVRVEAFVCLFLIAEFYRRFHATSLLNPFAQVLRQAFFCIIPICFLPGVWHQLIYFFPFAFWLSCLICLALYCRFKTTSLLTELKILVLAAGLISIFACALVKFAGWKGHGTLSLTTGLAFYALVMVGWKGLKKDATGSENFLFIRDKLTPFFSHAFYYLGIFIFIIAYGISGSASLALTLATGYFFIIYLKLTLFEPLKKRHTSLYAIIGLMSWVMVMTHLTTGIGRFISVKGTFDFLYHYAVFNIILMIMCGCLAHLASSQFVNARNRLGGQIFQLWLFHCLTLVTYVGALTQWFNKGVGPALSVVLVLHATTVLFLTLRPRFQKLISLAVVLYAASAVKIIFWDMTDFSLIQKVIAFIIIGFLLLGAAYQYQRTRTAIKAPE